MEAKAIEQIQAELLDVLAELSALQQAEVLDFALFLRQRIQTQGERLIHSGNADINATADLLRAEFAEEDVALSQSVLHDLAILQLENKVTE